MDAEDFEHLKERRRAAKENREETNRAIIEAWAKINCARIEMIQDWQLRIIKVIKMDIFLQSRKYHNISTGERGEIKGRMIDFLNKHFCPD